jgi:hypothetical protein
MNAYKKTILICIGIAVISASVAQEKKIYRWVDKSGKVHISDQLPPDANDQARKEYSASTGTLKKEVTRKLTAEEQAVADKTAEEEAYAIAQAETAKRLEQSMMSVATEQELQRSFDERTDLLKQTINSLKVSIQSRRAIVISTLNDLSDQELNGKALNADKLKAIQKDHEIIDKQVAQLARLTENYNSLQKELALILDRYRELKGAGQNTAAESPSLATDQSPEAVKQ